MIFKRFLSIFVAVIFVFAAFPSNSVIVSAASDAVSVTQDKPYKETLGAAYGGSMLVSFYAMGSDISVAANNADGNVIANISLNGYINSDSFTKLSVLYYIHTGKAFIYGGENDEYKETQTFTVDFNKKNSVGSVVFTSTSGALIKDVTLNEFVRKYNDSQVEKILDVDYTSSSDGTDANAVPSLVGSNGSYVRNYTASTTEDGFTQMTNGNATYTYMYKTQTDDNNGSYLKAAAKNSRSDQRIAFGSSVTSGIIKANDDRAKNISVTAEMMLPASDELNATATEGFRLFLTSNTGYQASLVDFKVTSVSHEGAEGARFAAYNYNGKMLFNIPYGENGGRVADKWVTVNVTVDLDAQKYEVSLTDGDNILTSLQINASDFLQGKSDYYGIITEAKNPGYMVQRGTAYLRRFSVAAAPRGDESSMKLSEQSVRSVISDSDKTSVETAASAFEIIPSRNKANGIALDTMANEGTTVSWRSSDTDVVTDTGVVYPTVGQSHQITLTATISKGSAAVTKDFAVTIPAVNEYEIEGIGVTGSSDGIVDERLVGGKNITSLKLKRYADVPSTVRTVCALYKNGSLVNAVINDIDTSVVEKYKQADITLTNPLGIPSDAVADTDYRAKVFVLGNTSLKPLAKAENYGVQTAKPTVYVCGDSTACHYPDNRSPRTGWGDMLENCLDGVKVNNIAVSGMSARTFITSGKVNEFNNLSEGDIVLVQFGHNDENGSDPTRRATINFTDNSKTAIDYSKPNSYVKYLQIILDTAKEKKANVIFVTSVNRVGTSDKTTDSSKITSSPARAPSAMKIFAAENGIPVIDLQADILTLYKKVCESGGDVRDYYMTYGAANGVTRDEFERIHGSLGTEYGQAASAEDGSHFNRDGADMVAKLFANLCINSDFAIKRYVKAGAGKTPDEMVTEYKEMMNGGTSEDDTHLSASTNMVNGVKLTWDAVPNATGYKIARDGEKITETGADVTSYDDIYFRTTEQLVGEENMTAAGIDIDNVSRNHKYTVTACFDDELTSPKSMTAVGKANTGKFYYYSLNGATNYKTNYKGSMNGIDSNLGFETVNDEKVSKNALIEKTDVKYILSRNSGANKGTTVYKSIDGYTGTQGRYTDTFYGKPAFGFIQVLKGENDTDNNGYGTTIASLFVNKDKLNSNTKYRLLINCYYASKTHASPKIFGRPGDYDWGKTLEVQAIDGSGVIKTYTVAGNGYFSNFETYGKYTTYTFEHSNFVTGSTNLSLNFKGLNIGEAGFDENGFYAAVHSVALVDPDLYIE